MADSQRQKNNCNRSGYTGTRINLSNSTNVGLISRYHFLITLTEAEKKSGILGDKNFKYYQGNDLEITFCKVYDYL